MEWISGTIQGHSYIGNSGAVLWQSFMAAIFAIITCTYLSTISSKFRLHSSISQLFCCDTCYTQCLDILMSMERTSEPLPGRYMDIAATFYYIRKVIPFIMSVSTQLNPHGHHQ